MALDKGNAHFHDLHLHDCAFDNCGLSMVKYPQRMSRVRNVTLSQCRVVNSEIKPCVFEDVVVEDLSTNPILLVWASLFRRVTLKGKIGKINLNMTPEAFCTDADRLQQFETARAAFYAETDWALDISEARLLGLRCEGVPLHLIRRDPQTQVILDKRGRYRGQQALDASFAKAFPLPTACCAASMNPTSLPCCWPHRWARQETARRGTGRDRGIAHAGVPGRLNRAPRQRHSQ